MMIDMTYFRWYSINIEADSTVYLLTVIINNLYCLS